MKLLFTIAIFAAISGSFAQDAEKTFLGVPTFKVEEGGLARAPQKLVREKALEFRCSVTRIGENYYWASRDDIELQKIDAGGAFLTFSAKNGSGYIRIIKPDMKKFAELMSDTEKQFDYMEHIFIGLRTVTYWGHNETQ